MSDDKEDNDGWDDLEFAPTGIWEKVMELIEKMKGGQP